MSAKLYTDAKNPQAWKALIAARYANVNIETPTFDASVVKSKSPLGVPPVLETSEGVIFEANAIARYVARLSKYPLYGNTAFEAGQIEQWIDFAAKEIELPGNVWVFPILGYIPNNPTATARAKGDVRKSLEILNSYLLTRTFLVGNRISLADIVVAMALYRLYEKVLDAGFRKPFANANRWYLTLVNQSEFSAVVGEVKLCEKMEIAPKESEVVETPKEQKPKEQKPKEQKPKEEKKKEEKKKDEKKDDAEEEEDADFEDEKKKSPLDLLPKSAFDLEEWKRFYSNNDTRGKAIPWFWEKLDRAGYSIWFADYKYNQELEKVFMTANLLSGFIQRLEKMRKYSFASMVIFGEEANLQIGIAYMIRGTEFPPFADFEVDDAEHYTWKKADLDSQADKELINDFWAWDGNFGGKYKAFNQAKIFK